MVHHWVSKGLSLSCLNNLTSNSHKHLTFTAPMKTPASGTVGWRKNPVSLRGGFSRDDGQEGDGFQATAFWNATWFKGNLSLSLWPSAKTENCVSKRMHLKAVSAHCRSSDLSVKICEGPLTVESWHWQYNPKNVVWLESENPTST